MKTLYVTLHCWPYEITNVMRVLYSYVWGKHWKRDVLAWTTNTNGTDLSNLIQFSEGIIQLYFSLNFLSKSDHKKWTVYLCVLGMESLIFSSFHFWRSSGIKWVELCFWLWYKQKRKTYQFRKAGNFQNYIINKIKNCAATHHGIIVHVLDAHISSWEPKKQNQTSSQFS